MTTFDGKVYIEAIAALKKAAEEVDQADALLRDMGCRDYADVRMRGRAEWVSAHHVSITLDAMVANLETATCEDCGVLISAHGAVCAMAKEAA